MPTPTPTTPGQAVGDLDALLDAVRDAATHRFSWLHGEQHWQAVGRTGLSLLREGVDATPAVVFLFALCHDAMRENDGHDPEHGWRAARLVEWLSEGGLIRLAPADRDALVLACETHTGAPPTADPTVGACYDAGRLNLWRVGKEPAPRLLSTTPARRREMIEAAKRLWFVPADWHELAASYDRPTAAP